MEHLIGNGHCLNNLAEFLRFIAEYPSTIVILLMETSVCVFFMALSFITKVVSRIMSILGLVLCTLLPIAVVIWSGINFNYSKPEFASLQNQTQFDLSIWRVVALLVCMVLPFFTLGMYFYSHSVTARKNSGRTINQNNPTKFSAADVEALAISLAMAFGFLLFFLLVGGTWGRSMVKLFTQEWKIQWTLFPNKHDYALVFDFLLIAVIGFSPVVGMALLTTKTVWKPNEI